MKKLSLLMAALLVSNVANASFITGNMLLEKMNSQDSVEKAFVLGYVAGVFDTLDELIHCNAPPSVTAGQVRDIIKKYIESNPVTRNKSADLLIGAALGQIWPCPTKPSKGT